ncbi:hypothetical protein BJ875DRAFT_481186 [Amylocarpus encephaloides]|uniref:Protein kinase domain-containing protein n=1 Tax=Amylocarpus encephaloides TaxID=45428 RepID=A0A9P7YPH5_9HELO|nr:hypothetical protein BJ875DRAFT_481186 [Amylocarpus encephaloides]
MDLRVPNIVGLWSRRERGSKRVGILEDYSYNRGLIALRDVDGDELLKASTAMKEKWAKQISETVEKLHEMGVVWGDGKADDVLVKGVTDDAWLIDFGGVIRMAG